MVLYTGYSPELQRPTVRQSSDVEFEDYPFYDELEDEVQDNASIITTYWTDIFIYWFDQPDVVEGSILAFFSDLNPNVTQQSLCYKQFSRTRKLATSWLEKVETMEMSRFGDILQDFVDINLEFFQFYSDCGIE
mmetsp:Transcript_22961/g.35422  ORF Transcript_22961/g.35422 Transcript_22961/m.35422 type:complete len:134 (-) Transcript_22961:307-708(-)